MALSITPATSADTLATATASDGRRFAVREGLTPGLIAQLRQYSLDRSDAELAKTSDYERFGEGSFEAWYGSKDRTLYALVTEEGILAAIAWFGPKPLGRKSMKHLSAEERAEDERSMDAEGWHTIVYRSYAPYRGTGLMTDFVRFTMETYGAAHPGIKIWAGVYSDNPGSIALAQKLGFVIKEEQGAETILTKE